MYSIWSTVSIDLATVNVSNDNINSFNNTLNEATLKIKENDKVGSIQKLVDLYKEILNFYNSLDNNMSNSEKKNKEIKYNLLIAYENIEIDNFDEAKKYINKAEDINSEILNDLNGINEYNVKKVNIILNQLLSSLDVKDRDIFYINYRNLIEEINLM